MIIQNFKVNEEMNPTTYCNLSTPPAPRCGLIKLLTLLRIAERVLFGLLLELLVDALISFPENGQEALILKGLGNLQDESSVYAASLFIMLKNALAVNLDFKVYKIGI